MHRRQPLSFTWLAIQIAVLVAVALHLAAGFLPEEAAWSVWPYTALPAPLAWLGGLAVASLALTSVNDSLRQSLRRWGTAISSKVQVGVFGRNKRLWFALIAVGMAIIFWLFRIRLFKFYFSNEAWSF